jgi:hypothetical protein
VNAARQRFDERIRSRFERHIDDVDSGREPELLSVEMGRLPRSSGAVDDLPRLGFGEGDEFPDRLDAQRRRHGKQPGAEPELGDTGEVLERIERKVGLERGDNGKRGTGK